MEADSQISTDISESERDEYEDQCYEELKGGKYSVRNPDGTFACPYCPRERKQDYPYLAIFEHAYGVGNSHSAKRTCREKANHGALARYLETTIGDLDEDLGRKVAGPSGKLEEQEDSNEEAFVWPWTGVVVNIPTNGAADGHFLGENGSKFKDELVSRGFNPIGVLPLYDYQGHSETAIVEFDGDWPGLYNALSFEKAYEADNRGKNEWLKKSENEGGLYCWFARPDDYHATNIIGEHLRRRTDLKTISEVMELENRMNMKFVSSLSNSLKMKNQQVEEMDQRCTETSTMLMNLLEEKEAHIQAYKEEIQKIQASANDHFQRIFNDHEKLKSQVESQKKELEMREVQLQKREAKIQTERRMLFQDIEKVCSIYLPTQCLPSILVT
ncbi:Protein INVOLVED IN DE NOVO 2 [Linum perenne]